MVLCDTADTLESDFDEARIVPGLGVDGVRFGDMIADVERKIGRTQHIAAADGVRMWYVYVYDIGPYSGLSVYYVDFGMGAGPGPVDMFQVRFPYSGKTLRGVGVGSKVSEVRRGYGQSTSSDLRDGKLEWETYCFHEKVFDIFYKDSVVEKISLGLYLPVPYPCR
jgi:hypothetical protein